MLANAEVAQDFRNLNQQFRQLAEELVEAVGIPAIRLEVNASIGGNFRGFDRNKLYVVKSGSITAHYQDRTVYLLEEGDILMPDITGNSDPAATVFYGSEAGASLLSFPALEFMQRVFQDQASIKLWTRLLITYAGLMFRITAAFSPEDTSATPSYEVFEPGEIIIRQGERSDDVFNLSSGVAEVMVDEVKVGRISEGEIFGAIAALTHAKRSATIIAKTHCSVVKVPKEQFTVLMKINPATIHSLLIDMANSIVNLNEQLVGLRRGPKAD
ncbi:MAG: cyclic nucleotide-binding domain-containing protein [Halieaceae bacterium]|jgi:CRP/FNR family transcriptional regulator, cyclic AMP receptor protein|nr:cyclic nucleotide-binding domain-containing protein [Halieaceae bacterium]